MPWEKCRRCGGTGWVQDPTDFTRNPRRITCPVCCGDGSVYVDHDGDKCEEDLYWPESIRWGGNGE